jgi:hypothetical protein
LPRPGADARVAKGHPWLASITLDAGVAIELADILDFLAEWIAEDDDDAFAGHGYTTNQLNALLTNLADQLLAAAIHP